ncbi:ATP-grasp domain-containing protein [Candidatus Marithrix sp. Canyon 246]|uniref:ATP-grasp domain-containing protein n=1 Tax=Candidatus Marithrix sp. Canyon 246 TaxID=1827136 RepID=UPI00084A1433|nr:ATP-grasp domain-containing protein [Candidatus Marithrix sp. Canyon 246]
MTNLFIHTIHLKTGNHLKLQQYPERALLLAEEQDIIILNNYPDTDYLNYLLSIGIGTSNILIPNVKGNQSLSEKILKDQQLLKYLNKQKPLILQPYISTAAEAKIAKLINATLNAAPPDLTEQINNKHYLLSISPTLKYKTANSATVIAIAKQQIKKHQQIVISGVQSYGGIEISPINNTNDLIKFENRNEQYLITKKYKTSNSPNIQYQINPNQIQELGITDQILDDKLKYQGNIYPSKSQQLKKIRQDSYNLCQKLQAAGYRGILGIDFIETIDNELFIVDINARTNTSSFGLYVLKKLFPNSYQHKYLKIIPNINIGKAMTFKELTGTIGPLFNKETGRGMIPYNVGGLKWGEYSGILITDFEHDLKD